MKKFKFLLKVKLLLKTEEAGEKFKMKNPRIFILILVIFLTVFGLWPAESVEASTLKCNNWCVETYGYTSGSCTTTACPAASCAGTTCNYCWKNVTNPYCADAGDVGTCRCIGAVTCSPCTVGTTCKNPSTVDGAACTANNPPTISAVSDAPDPQQGNSNVTFSSTASDPDSGNTIRLFVCKDASCTNCSPTNTTNCWAVTATGVTTNPTGSYTCPSCTYAANTYYAKVCDNNNACSSAIGSYTFTCKKQNSCAETVAGNCYSGNAVDGYCCDGACGGTCQTCAATPGTCTTRAADDNTECGTCNRCDGTNTSCQAVTGETGKNCTTDCYDCSAGSCVATTENNDGACNAGCNKCSAGSCVTRPADENTECSACNRCDGSNAACQAQTGDTGYNCTTDCYDCSAGSCVVTSEDNDGTCNAQCTRCSSGSCVTRTADDNTECSTCRRCDGTALATCAAVTLGQEGKNCTTACNQCDGTGNCTSINNAEDTVGTTCSGACKYCSSGTCTTVTCAEETYGTTCSGSNVCNNAGTCIAKAADGSNCTVCCTAGTSCVYCASGWCKSDSTCGTTGEPPTITYLSDSPDPQQGNSAITFSSTASDPNPGDTIKLYVCKDSSCTNCGPTNTTNCWASSTSGVTSNPTASYTCPSCTFASNSFWSRVCDQTGLCSGIRASDTGTFTCKKQNGCAETVAGNCYSGNAVDGYCCNSACTGTCQTCAAYGANPNGTCSTRNADDNTECSACNRCNGTNTTCQPQTGDTGYNCTTNCYDCSAGSCVATSEDNDGTCNTTCSKCLSGSCVARNDDVECSTCYYCSTGATGSCTAVASGQEGKNCTAACKQCNGLGSCVNITCNEDTIGTSCSGTTYICDNLGNCVTKPANGIDCTVCCIVGNDCVYCASGYCQNDGTCGFPPVRYDVYGWSWLANIGWISWSHINCETSTPPTGCPTGDIPDYAVYLEALDANTYKFRGYAWSSNIGWISFNRSETGAPPASPDYGTYLAKLDKTNNQVSGWARVLSVKDNPQAGGWSGWLKLRGTNYGVWLDTSVSPAEFRDWSWSDMVLGWMSFNRVNCDTDKNGQSDGTLASCPPAGTPISNYKVMANFTLVQTPTTTNPTDSFSAPCVQSRIPTLSWTTDAQMPYDYEIQIDDDTNFGSPNVTDSVLSTYGTSWNPACSYCCNVSPYNNILFGGNTYYWRVQTRNIGGAWSGWVRDSFITYSHCFPYTEFTWSPPNPTKEEVVNFTNQTTFYGAGGNYSWDFGDGTPATTTPNPTHFYLNTGTKTVRLTASDDVGSCTLEKIIRVTLPIPKWREIPPFMWLNKFLANLSQSLKFVFSKF